MRLLSNISKIEIEILGGIVDLHSASIAKRMSWAARRETKRIEDKAYSLLGIFNVNMSMMYGEGDRAFLRLREEIMKDSEDQSLFAWQTTDDPDLDRGLLAASPADFAKSGDMFASEEDGDDRPYSKTNRGLFVSLELHKGSNMGENIFIAPLNCICRTTGHRMAVYLRLIQAVCEISCE